MSTSLPATGSVEIVAPERAAAIVERVPHEPLADHLLIVLDIDGTILLEDETLSPGVALAVEDAGRAGHEVMLATGRSWGGTTATLRALGIEPEYVVCSNGAVIMRRVGDDYVRAHTETFDPTLVLSMLREHLPDAKYMVELEDGTRLYTHHLDDWTLTNARQVPFEELDGMPVSRVVVVSPGHDEEDFARLVEQIGLNHVSYAIGWTAWLDIAPQGVDKGTALELVREWRGIDPAHVLVMGDGRNDLGMFRWALENGGRAIAMAQAPDEVRDAAGEITLSVQEGGVAVTLRRL